MRSFLVILFSVLVVACAQSTHAATIVQRDTIGPDGSLTDGMPGASMLIVPDANPNVAISPGARFVATENGTLSEARFVVFASNESGPENDISFFQDFHLTFNLWNDGVQNGLDSFVNNPIGDPINGHVRLVVHNPALRQSNSSIAEFGQTGPPTNPSMFTTFLVSVDFSPFNTEIESGREYAYNVVLDIVQAPTTSFTTMLVGSRVQNGTEDVWFSSHTPAISPGFVQTQHNSGFELFGTYISNNTDSADFDTDNDVDGADFLAWQRGFGIMGGATKSQGDANDDGEVNALDLAVWEKQYGNVATPMAASATVPEPTTAALLLLALSLVSALPRDQRAAQRSPLPLKHDRG